jgi:Xaa-Pro aminopeptidase
MTLMNNTQLIQEKLAQATAILHEFNVDVWLTFVRETTLSPDPALELIADVDVTWKSAFLLTRSGQHSAILGHFDAENVRTLGLYAEVIGYHEGISQPLREVLTRLNPASIAINYSESDVAADGLSLGMYQSLLAVLDGTPYANRLISAERIIAALRGRKSAAEIERVKTAVLTTEQLFDEVEQFAKPGMTQREIADFVRGRIDDMGLDYAWPKPFNPIVTCGPESAVGHAAPGDVVLQKGHTLQMDLGVKQNDYCSDLQRMWYVLDDGETEAPPEVQRAFDVVLGAIAPERPLSNRARLAGRWTPPPGSTSWITATRSICTPSVICWAAWPMTARRCWGRSGSVMPEFANCRWKWVTFLRWNCM